MQIVIKAENGDIYFNPRSIQCGKEIIQQNGRRVFPIKLEYEWGSVFVSNFYSSNEVKAVVNEIYGRIDDYSIEHYDRILDGLTTPSTGVITFDIKSLLEKFEGTTDD